LALLKEHYVPLGLGTKIKTNMPVHPFLEKMNQTPHAKQLGIQLVSAEKNTVTLKLPFNDAIIGDPISRVIHGGAITTLIDTASGASVFQAQDNLRALATLDLRVDYSRPAATGEDVYAVAECYQMTHSIAFSRVTVFTTDSKKPIATALATFMRSNKAFPVG